MSGTQAAEAATGEDRTQGAGAAADKQEGGENPAAKLLREGATLYRDNAWARLLLFHVENFREPTVYPRTVEGDAMFKAHINSPIPPAQMHRLISAMVVWRNGMFVASHGPSDASPYVRLARIENMMTRTHQALAGILLDLDEITGGQVESITEDALSYDSGLKATFAELVQRRGAAGAHTSASASASVGVGASVGASASAIAAV
jgi:hypothetical protein